jgi:hypothetical protein
MWRLWTHDQIKPGTVVVESPTLPGKTVAEQCEHLREWVRKNQDTYRIERSTFE